MRLNYSREVAFAIPMPTEPRSKGDRVLTIPTSVMDVRLEKTVGSIWNR